ncbi:MAG: MMPL family transporter [Bacilli bacterium]|nr:MMPL family transporter [bacterium]MDY2697749.1 MMPL family transporter [Bacilli bacterium]
MKRIADKITNNGILILIVSFILLIVSVFGYINTRVNYDILVYLPDSIETIKGENILTDDFGLGSYAFVMVDNKSSNYILNLEDKIKNIKNVNAVYSVADVIDTTIPYDMLPDEVKDKLYSDNETIIFVTFDGSTSEDSTITAVRELRETVSDATRVSSMTAMVIDTMDLSNQEIVAYVAIAVLFCLIILLLTTDSYIIPFLLLGNIGIAIIYNMGSNYFLGDISYITKSISAVLQLGVTTDFSIFLYHKYEDSKKKIKDKKKAMSDAIVQTFKSILGSSLTTFAGFLALCTMDLLLGKDIGIVMAKGVLFGLLTVVTIFPAFLLIFDKQIDKTKHKILLPEFKKLPKFITSKSKAILIVFIILMIPAYYGNSHYDVYYKLDDSLPKDLAFNVANSDLAKKFNITSPEIIILDKDVSSSEVEELTDELKNVKGIDLVLAPSEIINNGLETILPDELQDLFNNDKYQLVLTNSTYEIASDKLNDQITTINKIVHKYDKKAIVAGEGALMKDLITIADHDFKMVNYTSLAVIFVIMILVLKSLSLPMVLSLVIEFAIFVNMSIAYYTGTSLPFIASIVVGTIQLGATIDYAILMSTTYIEKRKKSADKKKCMEETLQFTIPSIITSALCFFAATSSVGFYTKIDMIGSICNLLARGSLISMASVIFILPTLLMMFDKIVLKNKNAKKEGV